MLALLLFGAYSTLDIVYRLTAFAVQVLPSPHSKFRLNISNPHLTHKLSSPDPLLCLPPLRPLVVRSKFICNDFQVPTSFFLLPYSLSHFLELELVVTLPALPLFTLSTYI